MPSIRLYFLGDSPAYLQRAEFIGPSGVTRASNRGTVVEENQGSFQWTSGVKSLALLLVGSKLHALTTGDGSLWYLSGERGSSAAVLDYALSKNPQWLYDLFGTDASGVSFARRMFHRLNPERKRVGPVKLALNQAFCAADDVTILRDGREVTDIESLKALQGALVERTLTSVPAPNTTVLSLGGQAGLQSKKQDGREADVHGSAREAFDLITDALIPSLSRDVVEVRNLYSEEEVRQLWELDRTAYEGYALPWERFRSWWHSYPHGLKAFFIKGKLSGTLSIWPLRREDYLRFTAGELKEAELCPLPITRSPELPTRYWYIGGVVVTAGFSNRRHFARLFSAAIRSWIEDGNHLFPLTILALGSTAPGTALLGRLGFKQRRPSGLMPDTFPLFEHVFPDDGHLRGMVGSVDSRGRHSGEPA